MKDYVYLLEDPNGFIYTEAYKTRKEAREMKKAYDEIAMI